MEKITGLNLLEHYRLAIAIREKLTSSDKNGQKPIYLLAETHPNVFSQC